MNPQTDSIFMFLCWFSYDNETQFETGAVDENEIHWKQAVNTLNSLSQFIRLHHTFSRSCFFLAILPLHT